MMRAMMLMAVLLAAAPALLAATASETIYGRTQSDGSFALTNVPDEEGYQIVVQGTVATPPPAGHPAPLAAPAASVPPAPPAITADALASPPSEPQDTLPSRERLQEAAAAAERTANQTPGANQAMAGAAAGRAYQDMAAAGSATDRLKALYQASQGAIAARRQADANGQH